jgi:hypothetical protein
MTLNKLLTHGSIDLSSPLFFSLSLLLSCLLKFRLGSVEDVSPFPHSFVVILSWLKPLTLRHVLLNYVCGARLVTLVIVEDVPVSDLSSGRAEGAAHPRGLGLHPQSQDSPI